MDFSLSEEQTMYRDLFREFAEQEIGPAAEHIDRSEEPPLDLFRQAAGHGFFGAALPEEYGGAGLDLLSGCLLAEEVGKHCLSTAVTLATHTDLVARSILEAGTPGQKERYLPALAAGRTIGAFALTEPDAGSDAGSLAATAVRVEGGYRINGVKAWVTNGGLGGPLIAFAVTTPGARLKGISAFIIPGNAAGVRVGYRERTLGLRGLDIRTIYFEDVFAAEADRLGEANEGWEIARRAFDRLRLSLAAIALGAAEACLALGVSFAAERKQFGVQIAHKQALQNYVAEVAIEIEALRGLVRQAAWLAGAGQDFGRAAAMAKYHGARTAREAANKMLQVHGGYGFSDEYAISRYYRDVRALRLIGGTDELQRFEVARAEFAERGLAIQP